MRKDQHSAYYLMIALTIIFTILAIVTLLPNPGASKPNIWGYRSVCPFAPAATAICCLMAGISCTLRNRFVSTSAAGNRRGPWFAPAAMVLFFGISALMAGLAYGRTQTEFTSLIAGLSVPTRTDSPADGMREAEVVDGQVSAKVRVKVAAGTIIGVELLGGQNLEASLADTLGKRIIDQQSVTVDAVTGATASSRVFLQAVDQALFPK